MERSRKNTKRIKETTCSQKVQKTLSNTNQKLASTQYLQVQNSKHEHDLLKIIDCFIDGYGFVNSDHVNFSTKNF